MSALWNFYSSKVNVFAVADSGFPLGGGANSQRGVPGYNFIKISQKLHEIKENSARRGTCPVCPPPPLDLPLLCTVNFRICLPS